MIYANLILSSFNILLSHHPLSQKPFLVKTAPSPSPFNIPFLLKQHHPPLSQHLLPLNIPFLLKQHHHHHMMTETLSLNFMNRKSHDSHNRQLNSLNPELFWVSQSQISLVIFFIHFCQIELHFPHPMVKFCNQILQHETHSLGSRICVETDPKKVKPRPLSFPCDSIPLVDRTYTYIYIYIFIKISLILRTLLGTGEEGTVIQSMESVNVYHVMVKTF